MTAHRPKLKQIDMERAIAAAQKKGASRVVLRPDGSLSIEIATGPESSPQSTEAAGPRGKEIVI